MTSAAICGTGALIRSDVLACIAHLRAFAIMLAGDRRRADDLVRDTIEQTFNELDRIPTGVNLKVQMFAVLHGLHFGALRSSTEESAQQRESLSSKEGLEFRPAHPHFWPPPRRATGSADPDDRERPVIPAGGRGVRMPDRRDQKPGLRGVARNIAGFGFAPVNVGIFRSCRNRGSPAILPTSNGARDAMVALKKLCAPYDRSRSSEEGE